MGKTLVNTKTMPGNFIGISVVQSCTTLNLSDALLTEDDGFYISSEDEENVYLQILTTE